MRSSSLDEIHDPPERIGFVEGQVLQARDLNDEQAYRVFFRRLHNLATHGWGIAHGLRLDVSLDPDGFWLEPGFAWDGYGRELIVPAAVFQPWEIDSTGKPMNLFDRLGCPPYDHQTAADMKIQDMDVWLRYRQRPARRGQSECIGVQPDRWIEESALCLTPTQFLLGVGSSAAPELAPADPRHPPDVPESALGGSEGPNPLQALEPNLSLEWPVYLGRIRRIHGGGRESYAVVPDTHMVYSVLTGEVVNSASHVRVPEDKDNPRDKDKPLPIVTSAQMLLGDERFEARRSFVVRTPDDKGVLHERLRLDRPGGATLNGNTTLRRTPEMRERDDAYDLSLADADPNFYEDDLTDAETLRCKLAELERTGTTRTALFFRRGVNPRARQPVDIDEPRKRLLQALNSLVMNQGEPLYSLEAPPRFRPRPATRQLLASASEVRTRWDVARLNRYLLRDEFPGHFRGIASPLESNALVFRKLPKTPEKAYPWRIYCTDVVENGNTISELRIEIASSGDSKTPQRNQFQIGHYEAAAGMFEPCLVVSEDCSVDFRDSEILVYGSVRENATITPPIQTTPGQPPPVPAVTPPTGEAFLEELARAWAEGIASGATAASNLMVQLLDLNPQRNTTFPYNIRVRNRGEVPLSFLSVIETVSIDGAQTGVRSVGTIFRLDPDERQTVVVDHPGNRLPNRPANLSIAISVIAFDPTFKVLYGTQIANRSVP
jgi:hypothetical protein